MTIVMETILKRSSLFQPLLLRYCISFLWGDFISLIVVGVQECGTRKDEHRKDNYPKDKTNMCLYMMVIISVLNYNYTSVNDFFQPKASWESLKILSGFY